MAERVLGGAERDEGSADGVVVGVCRYISVGHGTMVLQTGDCCTPRAASCVYNKCTILPSQNEDEGS